VEHTEIEPLLRKRLEEIQARLAELAKPPEAGAGIGFGKRIGDGTSEAIKRALHPLRPLMDCRCAALRNPRPGDPAAGHGGVTLRA
jgi:hypothetical protein